MTPRAPGLAIALVLAAQSAAATSVDQVRDPRPTHHVVDLTGTLKPGHVDLIDGFARNASTNGELLVVVVRTTNGVDPRQWTTALFNRMRLDTGARNRGVILMAALDDRAAEIVIGDGYQRGAERVTDRVMSSIVVPAFKRGDPAGALVGGAEALARDLVLGAATAEVVPDSALPSAALPPAASNDPADDALPLDDSAARPRISERRSRAEPWMFGAGAGALAVGGLTVRTILRHRPRKCPRCGEKMGRLGEAADDAHLDEKQKTEERLGSVDYDVWACEPCGEILVTRWGALLSFYKTCRSCRARTARSSSRTIRSATYTSGGLVEVTESCEHCGASHRYTRTTPRRTPPSSSSSSSSRSSSSSSRSSGGSSSGRGSSGRW